MLAEKTDIISRLKLEILPLEGLHKGVHRDRSDLGLEMMNPSFPHHQFPVGAVHEFISTGAEPAAATAGFISGIISGLMKSGGAALWIGSSRTIYPPALEMFGIPPEKIIFVDLQKEKDVLWAMEEALKCNGLSAVVGEMPDLSFTTSRRFQLAVEQSRVTGFIFRTNARSLQSNALVSRWKITPLPSETEDELPGLGHPRWNVELLKIRNGIPGEWQIEWANKFRSLSLPVTAVIPGLKRKTG